MSVIHVLYLIFYTYFCVYCSLFFCFFFFFFQAEDGIRDHCVTGVQTCALPIFGLARHLRETKLALKLIHGVARAFLGLLAREPRFLEQVPSILLRQRDELASPAALRHMDLRPLQRFLQNLPLGDLEREEELDRSLFEQTVWAGEIALENLLVGLLIDVLDELMIARQELAAPDAEERDDGGVTVASGAASSRRAIISS